ncbi:hypothetical protein, partial [Sunxiuqinia dokdonensis]|uniref:hypothetical protein n=1 Tax=Sunxiuqinia dokdonensis TaxID=1409788 RepID=UPI00069CC460
MNTLETKFLELYEGERLVHALKRAGYENIPSNIVLDKTLPGVGATHAEIHAKRHSIIIEPNVPVIKGKVNKHKDLNLFGVFDGVTVAKVKRYLKNSSAQYKKILTTPEGFSKIKEGAKQLKINIFLDFFCLFDECERLNQDVEYRKNITNPVTDFFDFESKAFVSATPLAIHHPKVYKQNFYRLKIRPKFEYKKDITLVTTNDFVNVLLEKLESLKHSRCICIFYNSTAGISGIINSLKMQYNFKTFCSPKSKIKLEKLGYKNIESDFAEPLETYNFFTSRYFSAVDIEIKVKPDIIILTDLNQAEHTIIDPYTEAIQIQGRFRKVFDDGRNYNTLTHITNFKGDLNVKSDEELDKQIAQYRRNHEFLMTELKQAKSIHAEKAVMTDLKKLTFSEFLNKDGSINEFAVHNMYNEERVRSYYKAIESLKIAYEETNFFNVKFNPPDLRFFLEADRMKIRKSEGAKKRRTRILSLLKDGSNIAEYRKMIAQSFEDDLFIVDAFDTFGAEYIEKLDYSKAKIEKALQKSESEKKRFCAPILLEISETFTLGIKQD